MRNTKINAATAGLWASAFVIGALVIVQAGRLPGNPAHAGMAVEHDGYTLLTTSSGRGEDAAPDELLYVVDSRGEMMLVYEVEDVQRPKITLRGGASLPALFETARR